MDGHNLMHRDRVILSQNQSINQAGEAGSCDFRKVMAIPLLVINVETSYFFYNCTCNQRFLAYKHRHMHFPGMHIRNCFSNVSSE